MYCRSSTPVEESRQPEEPIHHRKTTTAAILPEEELDPGNDDLAREDYDADRDDDHGGNESVSNCSNSPVHQSDEMHEDAFEDQRWSDDSNRLVPRNGDLDIDLWGMEVPDQPNNVGHVVENTQILLEAWKHQRRRNSRASASSNDDDELELPPTMERHIARPLPAKGITFEDEIERFNSLNLSSPLGSRTAQSVESSGDERRRRSQRISSLHHPTDRKSVV